MQFDRIDEWRLTPEIETEVAALLPVAFNEDFGGRSYHKQRHHLRILARDKGELVGHMAMCFRAIRIGDDLVDIVGLAEVCTHPDSRGQGVAGLMLTEAIEAARETMAPFFLLFGTAGVYAAHGFRPVSNAITFTNMDHASTGEIERLEESDLMVLELRGEAWPDAPELDLLGCQF